ncbi:MAG TPA: HEAT repeat domain-containing protein [Gemmataceae bacterium]|nr:HEAT repeat domain-containing protein [Gemmataceae bacterium]
MSPMHLLVLSLGIAWPTPPAPPAADVAPLREALFDSRHPLRQSQAALLLVLSAAPEAEEVIRKGLRQGGPPEVFAALAEAVRLRQDGRFAEELTAALAGGPAPVRQAAADALAATASPAVIRRLQALAEDRAADPAARQAALAALGRSGRKAAIVPLLDALSAREETVRQAAADALADLTGMAYGHDVGRWRAWWESHKDQTEQRWLRERLAYQSSRAERLEADLERARGQVVRLHQQLYARLPAADRLNHLQSMAGADDAAVRGLAAAWASELLPAADAAGQRFLADVLLRLSRDGSAEVQRAAVLALGRVTDPRAFDRLRALVRSGPAPVRAAAARSLAQQARGDGPEAKARQRQVVPALQKALDDPALEVVVEAAEDLGALGVPEAGPVLAALLRHPSEPVRQTAALALERVADAALTDALLEALDDPAAKVRFSLVGALGRAVGNGRALSAARRQKLLARLEGLLARDADPGVRSRAATVLGECGTPAQLPTLWQRALAAEDSRVQEKAWSAVVEIVTRSGDPGLLAEWDRKLAEAKQGPRRAQLLAEAYLRWQKRDDRKAEAVSAAEALVRAQLDQGKWAAAFPVVRDLLGRAAGDAEMDRRLRWLLAVGELALKEGNRAEATRACQEARPFLAGQKTLAADFEKLEKQARQAPQ